MMFREVAKGSEKLREVSRVIGLTGPIGAGKDAVAKTLQRCGAFIIDADKVAYTLYDSQSPVWHELVRAFGSKILMRGGEISRRRLGEIVFSDPQKLCELNQIVHPYLREEIIKIADSRKAEEPQNSNLIIINAAVLKEIGLIDYVDEVWVVTAPKEKRIKRLLKKGLSRKQIDARLSSQMNPKEYFELADVVIRNEGTLKQLNAKVRACLKI